MAVLVIWSFSVPWTKRNTLYDPSNLLFGLWKQWTWESEEHGIPPRWPPAASGARRRYSLTCPLLRHNFLPEHHFLGSPLRLLDPMNSSFQALLVAYSVVQPPSRLQRLPRLLKDLYGESIANWMSGIAGNLFLSSLLVSGRWISWSSLLRVALFYFSHSCSVSSNVENVEIVRRQRRHLN